jgi:hypothetical protein
MMSAWFWMFPYSAFCSAAVCICEGGWANDAFRISPGSLFSIIIILEEFFLFLLFLFYTSRRSGVIIDCTDACSKSILPSFSLGRRECSVYLCTERKSERASRQARIKGIFLQIVGRSMSRALGERVFSLFVSISISVGWDARKAV